jgi:prophage maintenance system killer protein
VHVAEPSINPTQRLEPLGTYASVAQAHPFVDGNKRVAFATGIVFLQLNGYLVKSRPREFGERIVSALTRKDRLGAAVDAFAEWIRSNLQSLSANLNTKNQD